MKKYIFVLLLSTTVSVQASEFIIYPADGQSKEQQQTDEGQCIIWAKDRSGFDPLTQHTASETQADQSSGGVVKGAAAGAAVGAIVGNSDDAKKGAAAGAVLGRVRQKRENRQARSSADNANAQAQAEVDAGRNKFDTAYTVCLEGRGYSVKSL